MQTAYPYRAIQSVDQWRRSAHFQTRIDANGKTVSLAELEAPDDWPSPAEQVDPGDYWPAPMAFDSGCRLYRALPELGQVLRWRWSAERPPQAAEQQPVALFEDRLGPPGDFAWHDGAPTALVRPLGLAVDADDRLFVADQATDRVHIFDLTEQRLLRSVPLPQGSAPSTLAASARNVYLLTSFGVLRLSAHADPRPFELDLEPPRISRIAAGKEGLAALVDGGSEQAAIVPAAAPDKRFVVPYATEIQFIAADKLAVARGRLEELLLLRLYPLDWQTRPPLLARLKAKGYDGRGLVRTPTGRVGYFGGQGLRSAVAAKTRYVTRGRVVTFALDGGAPQNRWGIAYLDACVPAGCEARVRFVSADRLPEFDTLPRQVPLNDGEYPPLPNPELSPSMPDRQAIDDFSVSDVAGALPLYRRGPRNELVWSIEPGGGMVTYECPVQAPPGRYLWLVLELTGSGRATPAIARLRIQRGGHEMLRHLPALYSRDAGAEDFLRRYLAIPDSLLSYFDTAALFRHVLLDPYACPAELLPWLAAFVGLLLDERFDEAARRELIAKAVWLFRFRGTVAGLRSFLEIYLGVPVVIIEHFKLRGLGGALVGGDQAARGRAVVGAGLRVGLSLSEQESTVAGAAEQGGAAQDRQAHRFTVIIAALLSSEQMDVVEHILALHRPAHTMFDVCTVDAGMRIGLGMHLQLTTLIGASGGFDTAQLDRSLLGRGSRVGFPGGGGTLGNAMLDRNARLG